jgi:hypothetical protein
MRFLLLGLIISWWVPAVCQHRGVPNPYSFSFGVNLSTPSFIYSNQESFKKTVPNFQGAFSREFLGSRRLSGIATLGLALHSFNAGPQVGAVYLVRQINLSYLSLEAGPVYRLNLEKLGFKGGLNFRVSRIIKENFSNYFIIPSLNSSDLGLNGTLRVLLLAHTRRPYLQFNYYYGLTEVASNHVTLGAGQTYDDSLRIRSAGCMIGFYL